VKLLDGRAAVITGAGQGIGRAIAEVFAEAGAAVVVADLNEGSAETVAKELRDLDQRAVAIGGDVVVAEDIDAMVSRCVSEFGRLDVFVNNAGITRDATLRKMTEDDFDIVLNVHLKGTWLGTKAAAAVMREQGSGSIINMSSISGKVGMPGQTNYSAAKAGIVGMTKAAAKELGHLGVRVNAIQPGLIRTAMTEAMRPEIFAAKEAEVPLGRAGTVDEIANVALFLASDMSSYVTGTTILVSGGRHV
jgi:3-oxoacyl-[acyl-carrier protein] reductase